MSNEVKPAPDTQIDPDVTATEMAASCVPAKYRVIRPIHQPWIDWSLIGALLLTSWILCVDMFLIWWKYFGGSSPGLTVLTNIAANYHLATHAACSSAIIVLFIIGLTRSMRHRWFYPLTWGAVVWLHVAGVAFAYFFSGIGVIYVWL